MNNEKITSCEIMHSCAKIFKLYSFHVKYFLDINWCKIFKNLFFNTSFLSLWLQCVSQGKKVGRCLIMLLFLFLKSINTFTGTFKMAPLYWIFQLLKLFLYTPHTYFFTNKFKTEKILLWPAILRFNTNLFF